MISKREMGDGDAASFAISLIQSIGIVPAAGPPGFYHMPGSLALLSVLATLLFIGRIVDLVKYAMNAESLLAMRTFVSPAAKIAREAPMPHSN